MYIIYVWNVRICGEIENLEQLKFNRKLCTLNVRKVWVCEEFEYPKFRKFSGKLCTLYMFGTSGFAEKLNIQNYVNSTGNYVNYMYEMSGFVDKLNIYNYVN